MNFIDQLFSLNGRIALVTGGTHGLGMAIATGLANAGASIIVNDVFPEKLDSAKKEYAENGIQVHTYVLDVTDEDAVETTIPVIEKEVGPIDILVNNAGIIKRIPILEMKAEEFKEVLDVDLTGPFIMSKTVAKGMVQRGYGKPDEGRFSLSSFLTDPLKIFGPVLLCRCSPYCARRWPCMAGGG